jgi:Na+-transporting methylmalonyl-CoA/oxaloacetate decarboxylase gamma subunit
MSVMSQSLIITAIGMGLVFILIALLWAFMAGLVTSTNRFDFMAQIEEGEEKAGEDTAETSTENAGNKAGIVAAAVAVALATSQKAFHIAPTQPGGISNWQAVTRANTLGSISSIFNRKPRG